MEIVLNKQLTETNALIEVINARDVMVSLTNKTKIITNIDTLLRKEYQITDSEIPLTIAIKLNKINHKYKVVNIENISTNVFTISSHITNRTNYFITPLLEESQDFLHYKKYLVNSFIDNSGNIQLLYRYFSAVPFRELETRLKAKKNFMTFQDVDSQFVLYTFKLDTKYEASVNSFLRGKYSEMSPEAQKRVLQFHKASPYGHTAQIFNKSPKLKQQLELMFSSETHQVVIPNYIDLHSKPNFDDEMFDLQRDTMVDFYGLEIQF